MIDLDEIQREVLLEGLEDIVGLWEIAKMVREAMGEVTTDVVRVDSLRRIKPLLVHGFIEAGASPYEKAEFEPWSMTAEQALSRIDTEWRRLGRDPNIPDICWFRNTEKGSAAAQELKGV
jgi:hypothetical protein